MDDVVAVVVAVEASAASEPCECVAVRGVEVATDVTGTCWTSVTSVGGAAVFRASAMMFVTRSCAMLLRVGGVDSSHDALAQVLATNGATNGASNVAASSLVASSSTASSSRMVSSQLPLDRRRKQVLAPTTDEAVDRFLRPWSDCVSDLGMQASAPLSVDGADDVEAEFALNE